MALRFRSRYPEPPIAPQLTVSAESARLAIGRQCIEEAVRCAVIRLLGRADQSRHRREADEVIQLQTRSRHVQVPPAQHFRLQDAVEPGVVELVDEGVIQHHGGVDDPLERRKVAVIWLMARCTSAASVTSARRSTTVTPEALSSASSSAISARGPLRLISARCRALQRPSTWRCPIRSRLRRQ